MIGAGALLYQREIEVHMSKHEQPARTLIACALLSLAAVAAAQQPPVTGAPPQPPRVRFEILTTPGRSSDEQARWQRDLERQEQERQQRIRQQRADPKLGPLLRAGRLQGLRSLSEVTVIDGRMFGTGICQAATDRADIPE